MSQIFISYAREDQQSTEQLARVLEAHGWSVWWDRSIVAGDTFDEAIERALGEAGCVLVLWSESSVNSTWVRAEAGDGLERGILVPILLGKVAMPLAFRQLQAVNLAGWKGDLSSLELQKLIAAISRILESEPVRPQAASSKLPRRAVYAALVTLPVIAAGLHWLTEPEMVRIPAGPFLMGTADDQAAAIVEALAELGVPQPRVALESEQPQHQVDLGEFFIDRYEVTVNDYRRFLDERGDAWPAHLTTAVGDHPVAGVTWEQARTFCDRRGKQLATEAQWEKAARGEAGNLYPWADPQVDVSRANYCNAGCGQPRSDAVDDGFAATAPVGSFPDGRSPYGVHDMAGNVAEWVADGYDRDAYGTATAADPGGGLNGELRVVRGGSWRSAPPFLRAAYRGFAPADTMSPEIGFRCASEKSLGRRWRLPGGGGP